MRIASIAVCAYLMGCTATAGNSGAIPGSNPVSLRDLFFYSCVREYLLANDIPVFDNSTAYAVEYSLDSFETLSRVHDAAKEFAATIGPPNYEDQEHGRPALLAACLEESRSGRVDSLIRSSK